ncbi:GNAT family N-acetyltransferase [Cellulosimicrobium protaetiae]|uniref:GNAT family N-acetyltransferase n=1 Tax=Cellulosimicrobium protaetiae TaxID=2587808 RepID=A0A6M5UFQ3_9MICO|nr:GNAT family N-acetyltransferase [Cellulosimicrobium protaetiae]QJW36033.1 GNAT family N-acetyltransferase [Cellulosimicrobium protaetiae]
MTARPEARAASDPLPPGSRAGDRLELVLIDTVPAADRDDLLAAARALRLGPGQDAFVPPAADVVDAALVDPDRHLLVARAAGGAVVALGVLHPGGAPDEVVALLGGTAPADVVLFRGFLVDVAAQGAGVGSRVTALLPGAVADLARVRRRATPYAVLVLTVNDRNAAGRRAYARAGLTDRGAYLGGSAGPQRVMARSLHRY